MLHSLSLPLRVAFLSVGLFAAACGSSGDETSRATTTTEAVATTAATTTLQQDTPTTAAPTTTEAAPVGTPIPVLDTSDIPALVDAWGEGTGPALNLATDIIGLPLAVAPISDGGALNVRVDMRGADPDLPWRWDWSYETIAADPIGDIDIDLDESGPGGAALRSHYDDVLARLGWSYSNSTGSDPSSGEGGPQSVNHVYQHDTGTIRLGEIDATTNPLFVWADEDIQFRDGPDVAGYRIDLSLDAEADFIPVPMLEALVRELPMIPGARLIDVSLRSLDRPDDSFDADRGLRYLELEFEIELPAGAAGQAHEAYTEGLTGTVYQPGEESFFDPGFFELTEPAIDGDRWTQDIVLLDRYPGRIEVDVDPDTGVVVSTVSVRFEPNRPILSELTD